MYANKRLTYGLSDWGKRIVLNHVLKKRMEEKVKEMSKNKD